MSQQAQANLASDRHFLQKPSFGSGVLLQNAHLLEASASALVGFPDGCGWRHWLHKRSMPRHTISNQASGCHKLLLVKSRNGRRPCSPLAFGVHPRQKKRVSGLRFRCTCSCSNLLLASARVRVCRCTARNVSGPISSPWLRRLGEKGRAMQRSSAFLTRDRHMYALSCESRFAAVSQNPKSKLQAANVAPINECAVPA